MNIVLYGNDQSRMKQNLEQVKKRLNVSNIVYMDTKTNEFIITIRNIGYKFVI